MASERLARGLSRCAEALPAGDDAPIALLAAPEGEDHTLGLSLAELVLREAGVATRWTGRQTPSLAIEAAIAGGEVGIVVPVLPPMYGSSCATRAEGSTGSVAEPTRPIPSVPCVFTRFSIHSPGFKWGPIVQLDRTSDYESEGQRFESSWAHQAEAKPR